MPSPSRTRVLAASLAVAALAATAAMQGCYRPGGTKYSGGPETHWSTATAPRTITLYDTRTGEAIWTVDIPVGQQLVLGWSKGTGPNEFYTDELVWGMMEIGRRGGKRDNRLPVPPNDSRRLEWVIRDAPELPSSNPGESPFPRFDDRETGRG